MQAMPCTSGVGRAARTEASSMNAVVHPLSANRRVFDWISQERFARISGDRNPIHMSATAARRTHSGAPIVHGIHSLMWVLDCFVQGSLYSAPVRGIKAQFPQPVYVGDEVTVEISAVAPRVVRTRALVGTEEVLVASIELEETRMAHSHVDVTDAARRAPPSEPMDLPLEAMAGLEGCLAFSAPDGELEELFPFAVNAFGLHRMQALAASSCLVGMVVPGLHSLFSGLETSFHDDGNEPVGELRFRVISTTPRFRLVRIAISSSGLHGSLETVSRLPPVTQPKMRDIAARVHQDEFRGCTALIVGGSRGLGELTAKLIAAGGGAVVLTYASGKTEADLVVTEIANTGASCTALHYDVRQPAAAQLQALGTPASHVYYFATPAIFRRKDGVFDLRRFEEFNWFYVAAFFDLLQTCTRARPAGIRVFYPSSTALETRPPTMTEYTMAKAAGEVLCADLSKYVPGVRVLTHRLPRLPTDQTSSVVPAKLIDPIEILLPIVREMHA